MKLKFSMWQSNSIFKIMKNIKAQLRRLKNDHGIENNKQALKAIRMVDRTLLEVKRLNNKIRRINKCK
jgi:hypothetical protein